jgi:signal peptidase I
MIQRVVGFVIYAIIVLLGSGGLYVWTSFGLHRVEGLEMYPLVPKDKTFYYACFGGRIDELKVGDVVLYDFSKPGYNRQTRWMGRIVAKPGDRVKVVSGQVFVNGKSVAQDYVKDDSRTKENLEEIVVPRDTVYVCHDKRNYANMLKTCGFYDSRGVGPIGIHAILGKY